MVCLPAERVTAPEEPGRHKISRARLIERGARTKSDSTSADKKLAVTKESVPLPSTDKPIVSDTGPPDTKIINTMPLITKPPLIDPAPAMAVKPKLDITDKPAFKQPPSLILRDMDKAPPKPGNEKGFLSKFPREPRFKPLSGNKSLKTEASTVTGNAAQTSKAKTVASIAGNAVAAARAIYVPAKNNDRDDDPVDNIGRDTAGTALDTARRIPDSARSLSKRVKGANENSAKYERYQRATRQAVGVTDNVKKAAAKSAQKKARQKAYAKSAKDVKRAGSAALKTTKTVAGAARSAVSAVSSHPVAIAVVIGACLLILIIYGLLSSCSGVASGGVSAMATSYLASDNDLNSAEKYYTELEAELELRVQYAKAENPGYDEYRINAGDIGHNVYELLSYLTTAYHNFSYGGIVPDLLALFNRQYILTFEPSVETRTRTVTKTGTRTVKDPVTGEERDEEYSYSDDEEYGWNVLTVTLNETSFTDVISGLMNQDQKDYFDLLMSKRGNRQYVSNPLGFNWLPAITETYGYYVANGGLDFSDGVTVALPAGSDVLAGLDGSVTGIGDDYVSLTNKNGISVKYGNLSEIRASLNAPAASGDVIGVSSDSLRITVSNGSGNLNPLIFVQTGDTGAISYGDPGEPMSAAAYAALMAEAQKHLGKPYVFGTSGPDTFDCSGYLCYVLNRSGVASVGRTTAQGLYNMCVPVSPEDARPGDLCFFQGTYSTSNTVTHCGIYMGDGMMINAGDPVKYTNIETTYWQNHFYSFARVQSN